MRLRKLVMNGAREGMKSRLKHHSNSFCSISAVDSRVIRVFLGIVCHIREWPLRTIKRTIQRNMSENVRVWEALTHRPLSRCEWIDVWLNKWGRWVNKWGLWGVAWNGKITSHFRIAFFLCLDTSPEAVQMKMCSVYTFFISCKWNLFSYERLSMTTPF